MRSLIILLIIIATSQLISCGSSLKHKDTVYNPETQELEKQKYSQFFLFKTEIIPKNLELTLVTQLHKKTIPGVYTVKEFTRRLLPNDYLAKSNTMLYLTNLTDQAINFDLISVSIEQKHLPLSTRNLTIAAQKSTSIPLGEINVDLRLISLNTRIEYQADGSAIKKEHREKEFELQRNIERIKEDNKKMPEQVVK